MLKKSFYVLKGCLFIGVLASASVLASGEESEEEIAAQASRSVEAQQVPSPIQQHIDAADEETRAAWQELRRLEQETRHIHAENAVLSAQLASEADRQQRIHLALEALGETRAALPLIEQDMVRQLIHWIESDVPFLRDERIARVRAQQTNADVESAERIMSLLEIWRVELGYGHDIDTWRGRLVLADQPAREVEYLRVGRIGFYYLTPDGREGGVWSAESGEWQLLNDNARREVRNGLRIANEQRSPELLRLPLSVTAEERWSSHQ